MRPLNRKRSGMNRTGPVRARRGELDVWQFGCVGVSEFGTSEVRQQGPSNPLVPNFGTPLDPQLVTAALTESGPTGLTNTGSLEGRKS